MSPRRILKPVAAVLLAVGLLTTGVSSTQAGHAPRDVHQSTNDTGWGFS